MVNATVRSGSAILVTGAVSGIGEACAELFVERGTTVVLFDRARTFVGRSWSTRSRTYWCRSSSHQR